LNIFGRSTRFYSLIVYLHTNFRLSLGLC
jgi:hypothetical protein